MELIKNNDKNKIFVYDTAKGFCRYIKLNFSKNYTIDHCYNTEQFDNFDNSLSNYEHYFFVINSHEDILYLFKLFTKVDTIFLAVMIKGLENKFDDIDTIIKLNLNQTKNDLRNFLSTSLNLSKAD